MYCVLVNVRPESFVVDTSYKGLILRCIIVELALNFTWDRMFQEL